MANNAVPGGKLAGRGRVGGGRWRRGRRSHAIGSDDGSDEEYVLGDGGEVETESSDGSYASDASGDAAREPEEEEEEEYDLVDEVEMGVSEGRRGAIADFVSAGVGVGIPPLRRRRRTPRRHPTVPVYDEEDDCNDADDEDFAPDEDEDEEEEIANAPARRAGCRKSGPMTLHRKRGRQKNSNVEGKRSRAPATKRRKVGRVVVSSEDDGFVVRGRRRICMEATTGERKKRGKVCGGRKRQQSWLSRSDRSKSDSSDLDHGISGVVPRSLCTRRPPVRTPAPSLDSRLEKGKGRDDFDLGKQVCGICLSEEVKGGIRGLLDCCAHHFCFACIMEWSKVESRCPLCKRRFRTVRKMANPVAGSCPRTAVIKIPERDQVYQPSEEEIRAYLDPYANVVCMECQQGGDDDLMLLCDICDSPAHTYCAGLGREVPSGNWYCHGCKPTDIGSSTPRVQESAAERGAASGAARVDYSHSQCEADPGSSPVQMLLEASRRSPSLSSRPSADRIGDGAPSRHTSSLGGYDETTLGAPGFAAATVSGRRSIHHRIRLMISNNRVRWMPGGVAGGSVVQASGTGGEARGHAAGRRGEAVGFRRQSLLDGVDSGDAFGTILGLHLFPCTNNGVSGSDVVETAEDSNRW